MYKPPVWPRNPVGFTACPVFASASDKLIRFSDHRLQRLFVDAQVGDHVQQNEPSFLAAVNGARLAHEDSVQARAALLPSAGLRSDFLNTQGNGVFPSGRFVTNDGVHLSRE